MRNAVGEGGLGLDEAGRAAVKQGLRWAGRTDAVFDEAEIAGAYPEFRAQRETREKMPNIVDRIMVVARFDKDTKPPTKSLTSTLGRRGPRPPRFGAVLRWMRLRSWLGRARSVPRQKNAM